MKHRRKTGSAAGEKHIEDVEINTGDGGFRTKAHSVMSRNWRDEFGYSSPNIETYQACWLWDSCFHSIIWLYLGDKKKAITELSSVFRWQLEDGFVPHMGFQFNPNAATADWKHPGHSDITQPPMFGHAIRVLHESGLDVGPLAKKATDAFDFLATKRKSEDGLLFILHPSEAGCGSSPRWDSWSKGAFEVNSWKARKAELAQVLNLSPSGSSISSPEFVVESAAFNALTAFNMKELYHVTRNERLLEQSDSIITALDESWDETLGTWTDLSPGMRSSSSARTAEALLAVLVSKNRNAVETVFRDFMKGGSFESSYGIAGTDRNEPFYDPGGYWRGAGWPHLNYLFWLAAKRSGREQLSGELAEKALEAATTSGFSEYFNSETGQGLGAKPQSWACLPICMFDQNGQ